MKKLLIVLCVLVMAASCSTTSRLEMSHEVVDADGGYDTVVFKPHARAGIGGDIAEAKANVEMHIKQNLDGTYTYDLSSGQDTQGLSNAAQAEMISGVVQGVMQAVPAMLPSLVEAYTGMQANPPKPGILEQIDWAALAELIRAWKESGGLGILPLTPTP